MEDEELIEDDNINFMDEEDDGSITDVHYEEQNLGEENNPENQLGNDKIDFDNDNDDDKETEDDDDDFLKDKDDDKEDDSELDIDKLNKQFGTKFKDIEEFKNSIQKEETEDLEKKEQMEYQRSVDTIANYENYLKKTNEDLVRTRITLDFKNDKKDISDPDVIQEIEDKIEGLKDLKELEAAGEGIRFQLSKALEQTKQQVKAIDDKKIQRDNDIRQKNTQEMQAAFSKFLGQDNFYGVKLDAKTAKEVYKEVKSGEFFNSVNANQESIVELALIRRYRDVIQKNASGPTRSDGVKEVFDQLGQNNRRGLTHARNGAGGRGAGIDDSIAGFVK